MNTRASTGGAMVSWVAMVMTVLLFLKGVEATTTLLTASSSLSTASAPSSLTNPTTASSSTLPSSSIAVSVSSSSSSLVSSVSTVAATTTVASTSPSPSSVASSVSTVESTTTVASTSPSPSSVASSVSTATTTVVSTSPSSSSVASSVSTAASSMGFSSSTQTIPSSSPSSASTTTRALPTPSTSQPGASSSIAAPTPNVPAKQNDTKKPAFVEMNFSMPWGRLCRYTSVFRELMSRKLPVLKGSGMNMSWEFIQKERIKVIYPKEKCLNSSYYNEKAMTRCYVSNSVHDLGQGDTDNEMTKESFVILNSYWKNDRMVLLDKLFEGKVTNVQLCEGFMDEDYKCERDDGLTESEHIGIAIGISLAIIVLILIIMHCFYKVRAPKGGKRRQDDGRLIITNSVALEEVAANESLNLNQPPESQSHSTAEPEEVAVHTQPAKPATKAQDEMPLLSAIQDFEDGKKSGETKSDVEPTKDEAPLAKPEPDNVAVEEPIKSADEAVVNAAPEPAKPDQDVTGTPDKLDNEDTGTPDKPEDEGKRERRPTFTSSVTIMLTPDETSPAKRFEYSTEDDDKAAPAVAADERPKPDFSQSDGSDVDPNKGAINLGFDDKDEPDQENGDEETQF